MKVFIATEYRVCVHNGRLYVHGKLKDILSRYFFYFGKFTLCSRYINATPDKRMFDISDYVSNIYKVNLLSTLLYLNNREFRKAVCGHDLVIGRFDSIVSCRAASIARSLKIHFLAEVMADAWDGYWNHGIVGKMIAPYMYLATRFAIYHSDYAVYVTSKYLQNRYPCKNESINASNVKITSLNPDFLKERMDLIDNMNGSDLVLVTTAAVDVSAKGHKYVIKAIPGLIDKGYKVKYLLIGGGSPNKLLKLAKRLDVADSVEFLGEKSGDEIIKIIRQSHLYIQPSLQEGLPRAVIEAMSCACPAVGARTAGIPELLDSRCVFKRKSVKSVIAIIDNLCSSKGLLKEMARINFINAGKYTEDILTERRNEYFSKIKKNIANEN